MGGAIEFFLPQKCGCTVARLPGETAAQVNFYTAIKYCPLHEAAEEQARRADLAQRDVQKYSDCVAAQTLEIRDLKSSLEGLMKTSLDIEQQRDRNKAEIDRLKALVSLEQSNLQQTIKNANLEIGRLKATAGQGDSNYKAAKYAQGRVEELIKINENLLHEVCGTKAFLERLSKAGVPDFSEVAATLLEYMHTGASENCGTKEGQGK